MKIKGSLKLFEFLQIITPATFDSEVFENILTTIGKKPAKKLDGKAIPDNLDKITFGQYVDLQVLKTNEDTIFKPAEIIMGVKRERLLQCSIYEVFSFVLFIKKEIERIVKLWKKIKYHPSPEELKAGSGKINHGFFGMADWYAKRMGITDQQIVFDTVPWITLYMCMKMDNDNIGFEKRYRKILSEKKK